MMKNIDEARCGLITWECPDKKYTVSFDEISADFVAYRYGEEWQDLCGNSLILKMLFDLDRLRTKLDIAEKLIDFEGLIEYESRTKDL